MDLHHFYHIYADGDWKTPVTDHLLALRHDGLYEALTTLAVGIVGSDQNISQVVEFLKAQDISFTVVSESPSGWEQETLVPLHEFAKANSGYVSYAHTKGAAHFAAINTPWRRSMEYFNFCKWRTVVDSLESGVRAAGCHWIAGGVANNPEWGTGGMFGGNYWWSACEYLRELPPIDTSNRYAAEHWIGQLSEVMDLSRDRFILDMNPQPICVAYLHHEW